MAPISDVVLFGIIATASGFVLPTQPAVRPAAAPRCFSPTAYGFESIVASTGMLVSEAPQMAEGATTAAIVGGLVTILFAGLPILFLKGKEGPDDAATKLANLERGVGSTMDMEEVDMDMMDEEVTEDDAPNNDGEGGTKRGLI